MSEPNVPPPPPAAAAATSGRATTSLILGIVGIVCCQLSAPFAWWLGTKELQAIKAGQSAAGGQGAATAGMILGIIGTLLLAFALVWVLFFGGLAVLSALAGAAGG